MLGYKCLPGSGRPNRQKVCMRECTTRDTEGFNKAVCELLPQRRAQQPRRQADRELDDSAPGRSAVNQLIGQTCSNLAGITACMWNPDFEPRDPEHHDRPGSNGTGHR